MKKCLTIFFAIVLALTICFAMTACNNDKTDSSIIDDTASTGDTTDTVVGGDSDILGDVGADLLDINDDNVLVGVLDKEAVVNVSIPSTVKTIGEGAFSSCPNLASVAISSGVTAIEDDAFIDCANLTTVTIANSVTTIGNNTFKNCGNLTSVTFAEGSTLATIGEGAFSECKKLQEIDLPSSVTSIASGVFAKCSSLQSISLPFMASDSTTPKPLGYFFGTSTYPSGIPTMQIFDGTSTTYYIPATLNSIVVASGDIDAGTFYGCSYLKSVSLPSGISNLGDYVFYGCSSLEEITIPSSVTSIGDYAFYGCIKIDSITFEGSALTTIGDSAFFNCSKLVSLTLPSSVKSLGEKAFYWCDQLTSITLSSNLKTIGDDAFNTCGKITSITLPSTVESIGDYAFSNCERLASVTFAGSSVTNVGSYAFSSCKALQSIVIPNSVTSIGKSVFNGCSALESISLPFANQPSLGYVFGEGVYDNSSATGQTYLNGNNLQHRTYYMPNNLKSVDVTAGTIPYGAFSNCALIESVEIHNNITNVGFGAFEGCSSLESLTIPFVGEKNDGTGNTNFGYIFGATTYSQNASLVPSSLQTVEITQIASIADDAFRNCTNLIGVVLPSSVPKIGNNSFAGCTNIIEITIPASCSSIGDNAFDGCYRLIEVYNKSFLSITAGSDGNGKIAQNAKNVYTTAGGSKLVEQDDMMFYDNGSDMWFVGYFGHETTVEVPASVNNEPCTTLNKYAFYGKNKLLQISLPDSLTTIGDNAFYGCHRLTSFALPESASTIGSNAFGECYRLVEVYNKSSKSITAGSSENGGIALYALNVYETEGGTKLATQGDFVFYVNEGTASLVGYLGNESTAEMPSSIDGTTCTYVNQYAFYGCEWLTSVKISSGVTSMGGYVFSNSPLLETLTFEGDSFTTIGSYAFANSSIAKFNLPSSLTTIEAYGFAQSSITNIVIPANVTKVGNNAFYNCSSLRTADFEQNSKLSTIGTNAFTGCTSIANMTIPFIGEKKADPADGSRHFAYLFGIAKNNEAAKTGVPSSLKKVTVTDSATFSGKKELAQYAFRYCENIEEIVITGAITLVHNDVFRDCTHLVTLRLPNTMTEFEKDGIDMVTNANHFDASGIKEVYYDGTIAQWNALINATDGNTWDDQFQDNDTVIYCTDGKIEINY